MARTVGEVAALTGVTVRTLHHYDELGVAPASGRSAAGHRLYDHAAVERLQEVLLYRALDLSLEQIIRILEDPAHDRATALREHHTLLTRRAATTARLLEAVEAAMDAHDKGIRLTDEELLEVFGEEFAGRHDEYAAEAEERWGDSDAWEQSHRRTAALTKQEWQAVKAEADAIDQRFAALLGAGAPADGDDAMEVAEAHRRHIHERFYDCPHAMHVGLAEMYVADARFTKTYEDVAEGLAGYVHDAIVANAARHGA